MLGSVIFCRLFLHIKNRAAVLHFSFNLLGSREAANTAHSQAKIWHSNNTPCEIHRHADTTHKGEGVFTSVPVNTSLLEATRNRSKRGCSTDKQLFSLSLNSSKKKKRFLHSGKKMGKGNKKCNTALEPPKVNEECFLL